MITEFQSLDNVFPTLLITIHDIANLKTFIDYLGMTLTYIRSYVDNEVTCMAGMKN